MASLLNTPTILHPGRQVVVGLLHNEIALNLRLDISDKNDNDATHLYIRAGTNRGNDNIDLLFLTSTAVTINWLSLS